MMTTDFGPLPEGIHAATLTATEVYMGRDVSTIIVWADHPYDECPRCREPLERETTCPVEINPGDGELRTYDLRHGCGEWLAVSWDEAKSADDVQALVARLAADLESEIEAMRARVRAQLVDELRDAIEERDRPLTEGETLDDRAREIAVGDEVRPGVCVDERGWLAWDHDPAGLDEEGITVTEAELDH